MHRPSGPSPILIAAAVLAAALVFLAGCDRQQQAAAPQAKAAPQVTYMDVRPRKLLLTTELPGRTTAFRTAEIRPQVSGLLLERRFTEGSAVEKGQLLYRIDPAPFEAALENARASHTAVLRSVDGARAALKAAIADMKRLEANQELTRTNLDRYETLFSKDAVSALQRDQAVADARAAEEAFEAAKAQVESARTAVAEAQAGVQKAEAAVKSARINLSYTRITAPIPGRIGRSAVTEGAIVTAYQPQALATIQQTDPMFVDVPQSTTEVLRLRKRLEQGRLNRSDQSQNKVGLILEDGTDYPWQGDLAFQDITVDPSTGSVILRAVFPNPDQTLMPGMFVRALIREGVTPEAILIPQQAVSRDPKGTPTVMILDRDDTVVQQTIGIDRAMDDQWLVSRGLSGGERLIVEGLQKVRPGAKAAPQPLDAGADQPAPETGGEN